MGYSEREVTSTSSPCASWSNMPQLFIGFFLALIIALLAYYAHHLSCSGAIAAAFVGTIIFGSGGMPWAILLLTFFITSSALTRTFRTRKTRLSEKFAKGGKRDAGQVLGNGGVAVFFAAMHAAFPEAAWPWLAFAASLAAVNADTWATELGVLSPVAPRLITNPRKIVEKGTSGGISTVGTLAALAGAALIGLLAGLPALSPVRMKAGYVQTSLMITLSGLLGSLFDSLLGAAIQGIYYCPACKKETERHPVHICGTQTVQVRGLRWLNNDMVNFACAMMGALAVLIFS